MVGMMLHQDASTHAWLPGVERRDDLVVTMDDATSAIYSAFLVDQEGTALSFRGLREVVERQLGAVHHGTGGHRGLLVAVGALVGLGLGRQRPAPQAAAGRAHETLRPAHLSEVAGVGRLIRKAPLELQQRAEKVGHRGAFRSHDVRIMFHHEPRAASPHLGVPDAQG